MKYVAKPLRCMFLLFGITVFATSLTWNLVWAKSSDRFWVCKVSGSEDYFQLYPEQRTYQSEQFSHYQMINGLTTVVIHHQTGRFNRLTNLNLLPNSTLDPNQPAQPIQFFEGVCDLSN